MTKEAKQFIFALEQCRGVRGSRGMKWYGEIPAEIFELFDIRYQESIRNYTIAGMYVESVPQYELYTPEWMRNEA